MLGIWELIYTKISEIEFSQKFESKLFTQNCPLLDQKSIFENNKIRFFDSKKQKSTLKSIFGKRMFSVKKSMLFLQKSMFNQKSKVHSIQN